MAFCRLWHHVDAHNKIVGRLAQSIATVLQGKHKPIFSPAADCGDIIVVTNVEKMIFSGQKLKEKIYRKHTGWPGGLKENTAIDLMRRDPEEVLKRAVKGMLPKNRLRKFRMERLKIFKGEKHSYEQNIWKSYI